MQITLDGQEVLFRGTPISPGISIGPLFFCRFADDAIIERRIAKEDVKKELQRYRTALARGKSDLEKLLQHSGKDEMDEGTVILEAHLQLLQDTVITHDIEKGIREMQRNAEFVLQETLNKYRDKFNSLPNAYFRERFYDLQAIVRRVLDCLKGEVKVSYCGVKDGIICARELSVVDLTEASISCAQAFITEVNGVTSHAAIVAKAKGIPFVTSLTYADVELAANPSSIAIVDGNTGDVYINPAEKTLEHYRHLVSSKFHFQEAGCDNSALPPETIDGYRVRLSANIEMAGEVKLLHAHGGGGVGLFRSEYAFLSHLDFPNEEDQFQIYKEAVDNMCGLPIVIRAFDLGGDKYFLSQKIPFENNPFLGCRAIRFLLRERELFKVQLKAILRASAGGDLSIMLPMISSLAELLETKEILHHAHREVEAEQGISIKPMRIGCMIEVPSAALIADLLAKECDFLSIGTNDLVQYVLAVDRGNQALSSLYVPTHPSIIRLIKLVVTEANSCGIPVSICGEVAANSKFTALLLGLGVHELSVSLRHISTIKNAIRRTSIVKAVQLADMALTLTSAAEIQELLDSQALDRKS